MALRKVTWKKLGLTSRETLRISDREITRTQGERYAQWRRWGFLSEEAWQFKKIGRSGRAAPYIKEMIKDRLALVEKWKASGGNLRDYRNMVATDYKEKGISRRAVWPFGKKRDNLIWSYLKWYEENKTPEGSTWVSPTKAQRKKIIQKERKRQMSRLDMHRLKMGEWQKKMDKALERGTAKEFNVAARWKRYHETKIEQIKRWK